MSSRQLEDQADTDQTAVIATELGISADDLRELFYEIEANESSDGVLYGYTITFGENSDPEILKQIDGLVDGRWVRIGPGDLSDE